VTINNIQKQKSDYIIVKALILGDSGVGKTCFINYMDYISIDLSSVDKTKLNSNNFTDISSSDRRLIPNNIKNIINLQLSDGSWVCNTQLAELMVCDFEQLTADKPASFSSNDKWATALALTILLQVENSEKFQFIFLKTREYLSDIPEAVTLANLWLSKH